MRQHPTLVFVLWIFGSIGASAQTTVSLNIDSGSYTLYNHNNLTPLSGGNATVDGDGDVLQFGYYTGATTSNPFAGTWMALTGQGGANSAFATTSIGDMNANGAGNGTFAFTGLVFNLGSSSSGVGLPGAGKILSLRFYNSTTLATSTYYGAVSDASWTWIAPSNSNPSMSFSLDDPGVTFLSSNVGFTGTPLDITATPEPSTTLLFPLGLGLLALYYRATPLVNAGALPQSEALRHDRAVRYNALTWRSATTVDREE